MPMHYFTLSELCAARQPKAPLIPSENIANFKALIRKALKCEFLLVDAALASGMFGKGDRLIGRNGRLLRAGRYRQKGIAVHAGLPKRCFLRAGRKGYVT